MNIFKIGLFISVLSLPVSAFSCTEFRLQAKDKTIFIARSMEFGVDMRSRLNTSNRDRKFIVRDSKGQTTFSWNAKYGYVFFDAFNADFTADGMNEKGLSFGALYLPGFTQYQSPYKNTKNINLPYYYIGDWILSNFSSIAEVKAGIQKIRVVPQILASLGSTIFPLHFSIYDSKGKSLVIEFVNGKLNLHEDTIGVLTNSPTYDWHLNNINNYVSLSPLNPKSGTLNGVTLAPKGEGFGMTGLPGDGSPPSRFVKIATMLRFIDTPSNALNTLNLANHVMNGVDIPRGIMLEPNSRDPYTGKKGSGTTEWVTFKDLAHKIVYFRTYNALQIRAIDLNKIDFSKKSPRLSMPIEDKQEIINVTNQFLNAY